MHREITYNPSTMTIQEYEFIKEEIDRVYLSEDLSDEMLIKGAKEYVKLYIALQNWNEAFDWMKIETNFMINIIYNKYC